MAGKNSQRLILLAALAILLAPALSSHPKSKKERDDDLVRLMKAESIEQLEMHGQQYRKAVKSTFLHNGTYLISDTALWNVDSKTIKCWGHVKLIQDETILTSEKLDYDIDANLAKFEGSLVQLQNKKRNLLRTKFLTYNTKDSLAEFTRGAAMRDVDGQLIESTIGSYDSHSKVFSFRENVNMFTDSVFMRTSMLTYDSDRELANFPAYIDFWKGVNMLSAEEGWYNRGQETFFFRRRVHGMTDAQEFWSDTLYFYRVPSDALLLGNAQVQDTSRDVIAMADRIHYQDTIKKVTLTSNAAVVLFTNNGDKRDTLYIGGDKLTYQHTRYCDIPEGTVKSCQSRLNDVLTDAVAEVRKKAAEEAAKQAEEMQKKKQASERRQSKAEAETAAAAAAAESAGKGEPAPAEEIPAPERAPIQQTPPEPPVQREDPPAPEEIEPRQLEAPADSLVTPQLDSVLAAIGERTRGDVPEEVPDSLALAAAIPEEPARPQEDSLAAGDSILPPPGPRDSLATPLDSLAAQDSLAVADSLATVKDTTRYGFGLGVGNIKIFRRDLQVRCDSMVYCDLDSIARFYLDPIVWNEGNRQYTSDSLFVLVGGGGARKASLQSNAFVITQDDEICFDQIKGAEIMAYFDSLTNTLQRFDALGGASALFYLEENGVLATVNKVESKILSGLLKNGTIDKVYYYDSPKNNAYPVVQLPKEESRMKGFSWRPEERPASPEDVTKIHIRGSDRRVFKTKKQPEFPQAAIYFPGYISGIRKEIAEREARARMPKPKELPEPEAAADTLAQVAPVQADSLETQAAELLAGADSTAAQAIEILEHADSLGTPAVLDSAAAAVSVLDTSAVISSPKEEVKEEEEIDPLSIPTVDKKQLRKEEQEKKRALREAERAARIAERERKWAQLDSLDAAKEAARQQKLLEKERAKKIRQLKALERQAARDEARLQKYIEKYRKKYEREQKKSLAARKRAQTSEAGGEVPPPDEPGEKAPRGDAVLGNDGSVDDDPVLGSGGLPGP